MGKRKIILLQPEMQMMIQDGILHYRFGKNKFWSDGWIPIGSGNTETGEEPSSEKADKFIIGEKEYNLKDVYDTLMEAFQSGLSDEYATKNELIDALNEAAIQFSLENNL